MAGLALAAMTTLTGATAGPTPGPSPATVERLKNAISHTDGSCAQVRAAWAALPATDRNAVGSILVSCRTQARTPRPNRSSDVPPLPSQVSGRGGG